MRLRRLFAWVFSLFDKPQEEIDPRVAPWPFPVGQVSKDFEPRPKKKVTVPKATTRKKPAAKKTAAKKKAVAKKTTKKAK